MAVNTKESVQTIAPATTEVANVQSSLTKESLAKIIAGRVMVTEAGINYVLKCTGSNPYVRPDGQAVNICNFAGMTSYHLAEASKAIKAGDFAKAGNQVVTSSRRMQDFTPTKGEFVNVVFGYVAVKGSTTGETALLPVSVAPLPTAKAGKIDLAALGL